MKPVLRRRADRYHRRGEHYFVRKRELAISSNEEQTARLFFLCDWMMSHNNRSSDQSWLFFRPQVFLTQQKYSSSKPSIRFLERKNRMSYVIVILYRFIRCNQWQSHYCFSKVGKQHLLNILFIHAHIQENSCLKGEEVIA